jgi:hypothetical protein
MVLITMLVVSPSGYPIFSSSLLLSFSFFMTAVHPCKGNK